MLQPDQYLSIQSESRGMFREKASKFIAIAAPIESEEQAREKLDLVRKEYFDANHHCYAYRLGPDGSKYRVNDDGEPSGSAGRPIYGQLLSRGLSDLQVVVARYFGGTKLGIPGLIRAYRTAAEEALKNAVICEKVLTELLEIRFDYSRMNDTMKILKDTGANVLLQETGQDCLVRFSIRRSRAEELRNRFMKIPNVSIYLHTG
jgi:uncharacterized YigZ family protein